MSKLHEKFVNGKLHAFLKEKAPNVIDKIGELASKSGIPLVSQIGSVVDMLIPDMKEEIQPLIDDYEQNDLPLILADLANARAMNIDIQNSDKASWMAKNIAYIIDIMVCTVWSFVTFYLVGKAMNLIKDQADMTGVLSIYTTITAVFMIIINFHRGSSQGSKEKGKQLEKYQ